MNFLENVELMLTMRKSSYQVDSLVYPWNSVAVVLFKLFTLEGHHSKVGGYHFVSLAHFRGKL